MSEERIPVNVENWSGNVFVDADYIRRIVDERLNAWLTETWKHIDQHQETEIASLLSYMLQEIMCLRDPEYKAQCEEAELVAAAVLPENLPCGSTCEEGELSARHCEGCEEKPANTSVQAVLSSCVEQGLVESSAQDGKETFGFYRADSSATTTIYPVVVQKDGETIFSMNATTGEIKLRGVTFTDKEVCQLLSEALRQQQPAQDDLREAARAAEGLLDTFSTIMALCKHQIESVAIKYKEHLKRALGEE